MGRADDPRAHHPVYRVQRRKIHRNGTVRCDFSDTSVLVSPTGFEPVTY